MYSVNKLTDNCCYSTHTVYRQKEFSANQLLEIHTRRDHLCRESFQKLIETLLIFVQYMILIEAVQTHIDNLRYCSMSLLDLGSSQAPTPSIVPYASLNQLRFTVMEALRSLIQQPSFELITRFPVEVAAVSPNGLSLPSVARVAQQIAQEGAAVRVWCELPPASSSSSQRLVNPKIPSPWPTQLIRTAISYIARDVNNLLFLLMFLIRCILFPVEDMGTGEEDFGPKLQARFLEIQRAFIPR